MKKFLVFLFVLVSFTTSALVYAQHPPLDKEISTSMAPMLAKVMPAVVNVSVLGELPATPGKTPTANNVKMNPRFKSAGSGVIVDAEKGYIVTNAHVIRNAQTISVSLADGRRFIAKKIGEDKLSDLAIVQIKPGHLTAIPFSDSNKIKVGDFVAAIGDPFGLLSQTVTSGVVSALNRTIGIEGPGGYENFIQTDAPINPGNSGGALVTLQGELAGINTAILAPQGSSIGIGFAIPSNMVKTVMEQIVKHGEVKRGVLGVMVQNLTPDLADAFNLPDVQGAIVTDVTPGSPAAKAGLQSKDVVEKLNDMPIKSSNELRNITGLLPIGAKVALQIRRGGKIITTTTEIAPAPQGNKSAANNGKDKESKNFMNDLQVASCDQFIPGANQLKGVQVIEVAFTSLPWLAGLRPGDIIVTANDKAVSNVEEFMTASQTNAQRLLLKVWREGGYLYLVVA
jgi:serine protease Do